MLQIPRDLHQFIQIMARLFVLQMNRIGERGVEMNLRSDFEQERRNLTIWACRATGAYCAVLLVLACMVFFGEVGLDQFLFMSPNEVGDLLAGIAGPFALIWLVFGYLLQGIAIRQQAEQVALGARALSIQAIEMERLKMQRRSEISPSFSLRSVGERSLERERREIEVEVKNSAEIARKITLDFFGVAGIDDPPQIPEIHKNHAVITKINFDENCMQKIQFLIKYIDRDGDAGEKAFEMEIQRRLGPSISGVDFNAIST